LNTQTILKLLFGNRHFEDFLSNIAAAYWCKFVYKTTLSGIKSVR